MSSRGSRGLTVGWAVQSASRFVTRRPPKPWTHPFGPLLKISPEERASGSQKMKAQPLLRKWYIFEWGFCLKQSPASHSVPSCEQLLLSALVFIFEMLTDSLRPLNSPCLLHLGSQEARLTRVNSQDGCSPTPTLLVPQLSRGGLPG